MTTRRIEVPVAFIAVGALVIWLAFGHGYANYDTFYALLWGDEIAHGALARASARSAVRASLAELLIVIIERSASAFDRHWVHAAQRLGGHPSSNVDRLRAPCIQRH